MNERRIHTVVAGYVFSNDNVLLVHHKKLGLWLPVGGHIDDNEVPDDALAREIAEETGLDIDIIHDPFPEAKMKIGAGIKRVLAVPFHVSVHSAGDHDHCCLYYVCTTSNPDMLEINKNELNDARWFSKQELSRSDVAEDVRNIGLLAFGIYEKKNGANF